jgi:hypothetical protein
VKFLQKQSDPRRENAHQSRIVPAFVQDLDGGEVLNVSFRFRVSVGGHCVRLGFGYGRSEGKVADDIEREIVVP